MAVKKDEKTKTWYYYGHYPTKDGKRKSYKKRGFRTKPEARKAESIFRLSISDQAHNSATLEEIVLLYRENVASNEVKESTLIGDEKYYYLHIHDALGDMPVRDITPYNVSSWQESMSKKRKNDGDPYSPSTINHAKNVLSKYMSYAVRAGYIDNNPVQKVKSLRNPDKIKEDIPFWEVEEFKYFIESVDNPYWHDVFTFLYGTGLREGELFALQWKDINLVKGTCSVTKSITNKTNSGHYKVTTPKTKTSIRTIDLQSSLCKLLRERYRTESKKDGFSKDYFVFGDVKPLSRSHLARNLDFYINKSGVNRITPHGFRHSHVSYLVQNNIDDSLIAERLGHTVAEMRATYTHIYKAARKSMKDILDGLY